MQKQTAASRRGSICSALCMQQRSKATLPLSPPSFQPKPHQTSTHLQIGMSLLLHLAANGGHADIVQALLAAHAHTDGQETTRGFTPLHIAAQSGFADIAQHLVSSGANVNALAQYQSTALHFAAAVGHSSIVQLLLEAGAEVSVALGDSYRLPARLVGSPAGEPQAPMLEQATKLDRGLTPLHAALIYNRQDIAQALIRAGADVNAAAAMGGTPMCLALQRGDLTTSRQLVVAGAGLIAIPNVHRRTALHAAAEAGDVELVQLILATGRADLNPTAARDCAPLHLAVQYNHAVVAQLIAAGADCNAASEDGITPLHIACGLGHMEIAEQLVNVGANIHSVTDDNKPYGRRTALHEAAESGCLQLVQLLLSKHAVVNAVDNLNTSPLLVAVQEGHVEVVWALLAAGADPSLAELTRGFTPLHKAVAQCRDNIVQLLLDAAPAGVNASAQSNITPMHIAAAKGLSAMVKRLLAANALHSVPEAQTRFTPLHKAAQAGHAGVVRLLVAAGAAVNAPTHHALTALFEAATAGHTDVVQVLLASQADVHARAGPTEPTGNRTALHEAACAGHAGIVQLLLQARADVNAVNHQGITALYKAAQQGHLEVVQCLLAHPWRADVSLAAAQYNQTPLHAAAYAGHTAIVQALIAAGGDVNLPSQRDVTAMHMAATEGHYEVAEALLSAGADINCKDAVQGCTPLLKAVWAEDDAMVQLLLKHPGVDVNAAACGNLTPLRLAVARAQPAAVQMLLDAGAQVEVEEDSGDTVLHMWQYKPC